MAETEMSDNGYDELSDMDDETPLRVHDKSWVPSDDEAQQYRNDGFCMSWYRWFRNSFGPPAVDNDEYSAIYQSFQTTLQTLMTVAALLMGFVLTGAFINLAYSGDATFSQTLLVPFVSLSLSAFAWALFSFALGLVISLLGQQCYATKSCCCDAVTFFRVFGFLLLGAEICLYQCGQQLCNSLSQFVTINYITPSETLCPGTIDEVAKAGDTFCAQLGNDLFDAAFKDLKECENIIYVAENQQSVARPFDLSAYATAKQRKLAVCNQLDWYVSDNKKGAWSGSDDVSGIIKVWFGWDPYTNKGNPASGWEGKPASMMEKDPDITAVQNTGKILGEVMCHKNSAADKVDQLCKNPIGYSANKACAEAQSAYLEADKCSGKKFDDVMKCYHTCDWGPEGPLKNQFKQVLGLLEIVVDGIWVWQAVRIATWLIFWLWSLIELCRVNYRYATEKDFNPVDNYGGKTRTIQIGSREVADLTVDKLTVINMPQQEKEVVQVPVVVPAPRIVAPPQPHQSKVGVDLSGDGRPDIYYVGSDENYDGIPDLLQGGAFSLADALRRSSEGITTTAAPMTSGYSAMPSTTSVPLTKSFVSRV